MIRRLRGRHRWMIVVVALVAVPIFFAALAARPDRALEEEPPVELPGEVERAAARGGFEVELPSQPPLLLRAEPGAGFLVVEAHEAVEAPGLLLYWLPSSGAQFPEGAVLLGAVRGSGRQVLPLASVAGEPGILMLYSLGHGEELARVHWPGGDRR